VRIAAPYGLTDAATHFRWRSAGQMAAWLAVHNWKHTCSEACAQDNPIKPLIDQSDYAIVPAGFIGRVRVSLQSVVNATALCPAILRRLLEINKGQYSYCISALILLIELLIQHGSARIAHGLLTFPLALWEDQATVSIETIARQATDLMSDKGILCHAPEPNQKHTLVARIKTMLGRDLRGHDIDEELYERLSVTAAHAYSRRPPENCDCWTSDARALLDKYCALALSAGPSGAQEHKDWWLSRAVWLGSGTSSQKTTTNNGLSDLLADKRVRKTKALMLGHTSSTWFGKAMSGTPKMKCRAATKNEPGLKRRPLRAVDDVAYAVAAYASNNIEKHLSIQGSVMRQTPDDVRRTSKNIVMAKQTIKTLVLCLDYSSFNNTHTTRIRAAANLSMAKAYHRLGQHAPAAAAAWMAAAHYNHTIDGNISNQGLSSGERDTARDNTMLHNVYMEMAFKQAAASYQHWHQPATWQMCGDDEICIGFKWDSALVYMTALQLQGHDLQLRKSMISDYTGEFLQYNMTADTVMMPQQPVCPNLINFVSGSWYKTANYNPWEYPSQVAAAAASCVRRGASHKTMQKLAISTCSWLSADTTWKNNLNATPFFGMSATYYRPATVEIGATTHAFKQCEAQAVRDYITHIQNRFKLLPREADVVAQYAVDNIYGSVSADKRLAVYEQPTMVDAARVIPTTKAMLPTDTKKIWLNAAAATRYDTNTWMAVQLGLPLALIKRIGLDQVVRRATNAMRRHISSKDATRPLLALAPGQLALLPGAILPFF